MKDSLGVEDNHRLTVVRKSRGNKDKIQKWEMGKEEEEIHTSFHSYQFPQNSGRR